MGGLAVEGGVDVHPAGQHDAVEAVENRGRVLRPDRGQHHRDGPGLLDGPHVVLAHPVEALLVSVPEREADDRTRHIRSGTGMPRRSSRTAIWRTNASTSRVRPARASSLSAWRTSLEA